MEGGRMAHAKFAKAAKGAGGRRKGRWRNGNGAVMGRLGLEGRMGDMKIKKSS
jgi:hypothetical protein